MKKIITSLLCLTIFVSFTQNAGASLNLFCGDWEKAYNKCVDYNEQFAKNMKQCVNNMHVYKINIQKYSAALEECHYQNNTATLSLLLSTCIAFLSGVFVGRRI